MAELAGALVLLWLGYIYGKSAGDKECAVRDELKKLKCALSEEGARFERGGETYVKLAKEHGDQATLCEKERPNSGGYYRAKEYFYTGQAEFCFRAAQVSARLECSQKQENLFQQAEEAVEQGKAMSLAISRRN